MRTWGCAREKGRAALQKQIFVGWKGTRCFNLVAEPRLLLAFATLLIAVVAGYWCGGGSLTSSSDNLKHHTGHQHDSRQVSFKVEHQTTFTTILAKSTTMTERVVTAATTIDGSNSDARSDIFAADMTTTTMPGVPLKPIGVPSNLNVDDADGLETLSLFEQHSTLIGTGDDSDHVHSHSGHVYKNGDSSNSNHFQGHSGNLDNADGDNHGAMKFRNNAGFDNADRFHRDHDHIHSGHFDSNGNHVQSRSGNHHNDVDHDQSRSGNHNYNGNQFYGHAGNLNRNADARHDPWWYETSDDEVSDLGTTVTSVEDLSHDSKAVFHANQSLSWHDGFHNNGSFNGSNNSVGYNHTWFSGLREILWADPRKLSSMRKSSKTGAISTVQWTLRHRLSIMMVMLGNILICAAIAMMHHPRNQPEGGGVRGHPPFQQDVGAAIPRHLQVGLMNNHPTTPCVPG